MEVICPSCGKCETLAPKRWRCDCSDAWEPVEPPAFDPEAIDARDASLWRYARLLPLGFSAPLFRMNAGWTPLLPLDFEGREIMLKVEYLSPSGSFKDRGTEVMMNLLAAQGVRRVTDDSSGNAGASVAAYAARAGMECTVFVPAYASPPKQIQIAQFGAKVRPIPGPRHNAHLASLDAVEQGWVPAYHAYHPAFLLGQQTVAWEIWEQLGRTAPDWYVLPVGQGVHLLGAWLGWKRLHGSGLTSKIPHLVAVQAHAVAPLCRAFEQQAAAVAPVEPTGPSVAEGLAIAAPVRGARLLESLRASQGTCIQVDDPAILEAQKKLARRGFYVEPTSATIIAALEAVYRLAKPEDVVVVALTGSGLKGSPSLQAEAVNSTAEGSGQ